MSRTGYQIEYKEKAKNSLKALPKITKERIIRAIEERLAEAPSDVGKPLVREWKGHRRLRVGAYRVIYKVFEETVLVLIVEIDLRHDIY